MPGLRIETGFPDGVNCAVLDGYGKRVAAASNNTINILGASETNSSHLATLTGHQGPVLKVAWAHPKFGSILASCSYDGKVILWKETEQNQWNQFHVFNDHKSAVNSVAWAPSEIGLCLACASSDGSISIYSANADGLWDTARIDQAHPVGVTSVSWCSSTAAGSSLFSGLVDPVLKLVSGGYDSTVKVWTLANGVWTLESPPLKLHSDSVVDVAWSPNFGHAKSMIASASDDGRVIIWTKTEEKGPWNSMVLNDFKNPVSAISWSLTGDVLAVADVVVADDKTTVVKTNFTFWKEEADGEWKELPAPEA